MPTLKTVLVLIAALSVLSDAAPSAAGGPHRRSEPVSVTNTPTVIIGNTQPIPVVGIGGGTGGSVPEDGAQFTQQNVVGQGFILFGDVARPGKRFVVETLSVSAGLTPNDCSLMQVRVDDAAGDAVRLIVPLVGSTAGMWGGTQAVKMFVDPGQRILVVPFPTCDAPGLTASVVGHYVDR